MGSKNGNVDCLARYPSRLLFSNCFRCHSIQKLNPACPPSVFVLAASGGGAPPRGLGTEGVAPGSALWEAIATPPKASACPLRAAYCRLGSFVIDSSRLGTSPP